MNRDLEARFGELDRQLAYDETDALNLAERLRAVAQRADTISERLTRTRGDLESLRSRVDRATDLRGDGRTPPPDDLPPIDDDEPPVLPPRDDPPARTQVLGEQFLPNGAHVFEDCDFYGSTRSALIGPNSFTPKELDWEADAHNELRVRDSSFRALKENYPPAVDADTGIMWGIRVYNLAQIELTRVDAANLIGPSYASPGQHPLVTARDGHFCYVDIAPGPGREFLFQALAVRNITGNGLQFVTSDAPNRVGQSQKPRHGGRILVADSSFIDCCQGAMRGAFAISLFDVHAPVEVSNTRIEFGVEAKSYPRWNWDGNPETAYTSEGCLVQRGICAGVTLRDSAFLQAGDRPGHAAISVNGAESLTIEDCEIVGDVVVNPPNPHWWRHDPRTKSVSIRGCTGDGRLFIGGEYIGALSQNREVTI